MEQTYKFTKKKIDTTFDVVVVGGGLSGVIASIASARLGKKVVLIEKYGFLGGMATAGLVSPFMTFHEGGSGKVVNAGIFRELLDKMYQAGALKYSYSQDYREQILKKVLDDMTIETGVKILFHSKLASVNKVGKKIQNITISTVSGNVDIYGKTFIDATGNGDLFAFSGEEFFLRSGPNDFSQPMTTCFNLIKVDWSKFDHKKANQLYNEYQSQGKIKNPRENILVFRSPIDDVMHLNTTRVIKKNPCDVEEITEAELIGREQTMEMYDFLKNNFECCKDSELITIADEIGIRESRRLLGLYVITEDDILSTKKFDDSIARGAYEVDIHNPDGSGTTIKFIPPNDYYTIPYRSLVPVDCDNLIVAGRCISCTHEAHSALRIMPICSSIGEAAGIASAIASETEIPFSKLDVKKVQEVLDKNGGLY